MDSQPEIPFHNHVIFQHTNKLFVAPGNFSRKSFRDVRSHF